MWRITIIFLGLGHLRWLVWRLSDKQSLRFRLSRQLGQDVGRSVLQDSSLRFDGSLWPSFVVHFFLFIIKKLLEFETWTSGVRTYHSTNSATDCPKNKQPPQRILTTAPDWFWFIQTIKYVDVISLSWIPMSQLETSDPAPVLWINWPITVALVYSHMV